MPDITLDIPPWMQQQIGVWLQEAAAIQRPSFVRFTTRAGSPIAVNPRHVTSVAFLSDDAVSIRTVEDTVPSSEGWCVQGSFEEVLAKLEGRDP